MIRCILFRLSLALAVSLSLLSAQTANPNPPKPKSQKEVDAYLAMAQAPDPDARIAAGTELITKFSTTDFKAIALYFIAASYEQKGDLDNAVVYAEKCLETDPKFYGAQITIANALSVRTKEFDLDKEEKLSRAEKMAKSALELLVSAPKPNPALPDEQWTAIKNDVSGQAHQALGLAALVRKKYDACADELKLAVQLSSQPDPGTMVRLASCQINVKKYDDALAILDKALADPNSAPAVKNAAVSLKISANKAKAEAK